jgi:hypothetical protein
VSLLRPRTPLQKLAARIHAHLERFESDPAINTTTTGTLRCFYMAGCSTSGRFIYVRYISYQGSTALSKAEAETYVAWLDAGNVGRHFEAFRGS